MIEREWREASDLRPSRFGLAAVLVTAAILRFWSLGHGVPFALGVDEPEIMLRAVDMMRHGEYHPHFFDYPGLYIYVQFLVSVARFLAGAVSGEWGSIAEAPTSAFYVWGRAVTATLGVATVFVVFQIGMRWGARHALLAAGLMAVLPQHVRESPFVLADVPLTFFVALTLLLSLRAHERPTTRWAVLLVCPLVYFWFVSRQQIVYARYLLPIMPSLCVLVATAVISGVSLLRRYDIPRAPRTALIAGLTIAALAPPAWSAIGFDRSISRTGTTQLAYEWVSRNIPKDASIVVESRNLLLPDHPKAKHVAQLRHGPLEHYAEQKVEYLIASSICYGQYFQSPERFRQEYAEYRAIFDQSQELARFTPSDTNPGSELVIFRVRH